MSDHDTDDPNREMTMSDHQNKPGGPDMTSWSRIERLTYQLNTVTRAYDHLSEAFSNLEAAYSRLDEDYRHLEEDCDRLEERLEKKTAAEPQFDGYESQL